MIRKKVDFSVPDDTKFQWRNVNTKHRKSVISFCNKHCNIDLTISSPHWMVGLSPLWGRFVVAKGREGGNSFIYLQNHYAHIVLEMSFHVQFSWFWSLMRSGDDFFNWVEDMWNGLDDFFSFEKEYSALEKMHACRLARQSAVP